MGHFSPLQMESLQSLIRTIDQEEDVAEIAQMANTTLTVADLCREAIAFAEVESSYPEPSLYGVTDGKAVGTYLEHKFRAHLQTRYTFAPCNSALGIDFPDLAVDMKVTSISQPQSSCPFKSARQKIFGLGYSLLVFVYDKKDDVKKGEAGSVEGIMRLR